jgi:hypothetical protein
LISPGMQMLYRSQAFANGGDDQFTKTGTWTLATTANVWDRAPYGYTYRVTGAPKYRTDGGAWINFPTVAVDNLYHRFHIATPVTSTIQITNAGVTAVLTWTKPVWWRPIKEFSIDYVSCGDTALIGVTPYFVNSPQTANGLIVHNLGANGQRLNNLCAATAGDRYAFFDSVVLDGAAMSHAPNAGVTLMHINDIAINDAPSHGVNLTTFFNRTSPLGPVTFMNPWECVYPTFPQAAQTAYRAQAKTTAATLGAKMLDLYDAWAANGWVGFQAAQDAGLLSDATHETQAGHIDLAPRIYWHLRQNVLNLGSNEPSLYTADATASTLAVKGKGSSVVFKAASPVAIT